MSTSDQYLNLITSEHKNKPKFIATVKISTDVYAYFQALIASLLVKFDLDTAPGWFLDQIGKWVGVTRNVNIPITGIFFSWDGDDPYIGWDFGSWQPPNAPATITVLPDDTYRTLIRAKIAANQWDGTTTGAYAVWSSVFPETTILIQDYQDMSYAFILLGGTIDALTLALLTGGYLPLKPEGVRIAAYYVSVDDNPLFAWDVESDLLAGWDEGSWLREITP